MLVYEAGNVYALNFSIGCWNALFLIQLQLFCFLKISIILSPVHLSSTLSFHWVMLPIEVDM